MEFHKTCRTLSIFAFNEVIKTDDFRYLLKDFDDMYEDDFKLGLDDVVEARGIFKEILYEYAALTANRQLLMKYNSEFNIKKEEFRYNIAENVLKNFVDYGDKSVLALLNTLEIPFDIEGDIEAQLVKTTRFMRAFGTRIKIMKIKHDEKFNRNINKRIKDEVVDNLDEEATMLEVSLKLSYSIDTRKVSVKKWIDMWNVAARMNKPKPKTSKNG